MPVITSAEWDNFTARHPNAHVLQTSAWGELKSNFGWQSSAVSSADCGAQILFRQLPLGFSLAYIPKGPIGNRDRWKELWPNIDNLCRARRSILLIVEPDLWTDNGNVHDKQPPPGFKPGVQKIQPQRTIVVSLDGEENDLLARMKQKTRYNIRLAAKHGVKVSPSHDVTSFYRLMVDTGKRDNFGIHSLEYYQRAYDLFYPQRKCELFLAEYQQNLVAAVMVFAHMSRAWYFYGASSDQFREHMPAYLLQWEAMKWARSLGCRMYDLWGVPDAEEGILESEFTKRSDGLWGVYRFKRGFGGELRHAAGPWQRIYNPGLYQFYKWWVQRKQID